MENKTCFSCHSEMRYVKAGVSKTSGKPYDAFWACPNKCRQPYARPAPQNPANNEIKGVLEGLKCLPCLMVGKSVPAALVQQGETKCLRCFKVSEPEDKESLPF